MCRCIEFPEAPVATESATDFRKPATVKHRATWLLRGKVSDLDERFPGFKRPNELLEIGLNAPQQLCAACIPNPYPDDCRPGVQDAMDGKVLVLRHDHSRYARRVATDGVVRGLSETTVSDVLGLMSKCYEAPRQRRRKLSVDEEAQLGAPKNRVIVLPSGEFKDCADVFGLEVRIVLQNLLL